jgi:hypothetical protein
VNGALAYGAEAAKVRTPAMSRGWGHPSAVTYPPVPVGTVAHPEEWGADVREWGEGESRSIWSGSSGRGQRLEPGRGDSRRFRNY